MTISTTNASAASSIVSEFGGSSGSVEMMIGVGLVKDTEAVYFQYLGEERTPTALMLPSGKPLTSLQNVKLTGISIAEDVGEFKSTKLNVYLTTSQGTTVLITSGLTTLWSQCVLTGLMSVFEKGSIEEPITLDTWKGKDKMRPCFAAIRQNRVKMSDNDLYTQFVELRAARNRDKIDVTCRDCVNILRNAVSSFDKQVEEAVVVERPEGDFERDDY